MSRREQRFGALAELEPGLALAERFPALELGQLLHEPAEPLDRRLRQHAGSGLRGADLVRGRARRLQLSRGQRLLRGVQQPVHMLPRQRRDLLRRLDLRQPALLDHDQRGLEALRQRGRAHRAIERAPALRQIRVVDRRAGRELLGFDDERLGARQRVAILLPAGDAAVAASSSIASAAASLWPCAMSRNAASSPRFSSKPSASAGGCSASIHSRNRRSNCARVRCSSRSRSNRACTGPRAASQRARRASSPREIERLPAPDDVDDGADDRSRLAGERLQLLQAARRPPFALPSRSAMASRRCRARRATPRSLFFAASAILRRPSGRVHASRRLLARFGELGASVRHRPAVPRRGCARARRGAGRHPRAARDVGADGIRAGLRLEECGGSRSVRGVRTARRRAPPPPPRARPDRIPSSMPRQAPAAPSTAAPPRCGPPARDRRRAVARARRNPAATPRRPAPAARGPRARAARNGRRSS